MKHVYSHYYLLLVFLFMALQTAQAQNFGYVNSNEILSEMPEVKQADATIETLQKTLQQQLQASADKLQADYRAIQQKAEIGQLSHAQQEEEAKKLHERQNQLSVEEQNMVTQLQKKREELLGPIYDKVNKAIAAVANEKGYKMVFDQGVLLYSSDALNVSPLVKAKLGL